MTDRVGVWLVGALGGLATTVVAGARALARGIGPAVGLATEQLPLRALGLCPFDSLVFGGHEVRRGTLLESARQIGRENGSLPRDLIDAVAPDLAAADAWIRPGIATNCGDTVQRMIDRPDVARSATSEGGMTLRAQVERIRGDLEQFRASQRLARSIVVNLASTEPPLDIRPEHATLDALERAIDTDRRDVVRASLIYAYAAIGAGMPYVNFTPSNAALVPAIEELARRSGAPFMGSDGKTGETLVKSALAPMFLHRALRVLSWQGYNMLGDRDGEVLADDENKRSKIRSKDNVLQKILGYPVHTHVGIDFVPSLKDEKTAFDFVHFEGFLGHRMRMTFTWHGCDAVLAAPIVLDLVRMADLAARRGESGPMRHLACFFKDPHGSDEHDFHKQWDALVAYAALS